MNCEQVQERLSEYLEGSLSPGDYQAVKGHLSSCSRCKTEAETLAQTIRAVANLSHLEPPPSFSQKVMARIREEANKPTLWQRLFLPIWIKIPVHVMALLLVSGLAVYLYQTNQPFNTEIMKSMPSESESLKAGKVAPLTPDRQEELMQEENAPVKPSNKESVGELRSDTKSFRGERETKVPDKREDISSNLSEREIRAKEGIAPAPKSDQRVYYELSFVPEGPLEGMKVVTQKLEDLVKQMGGEYLQIDEKIGKRKQDLLLRSQILWLTIPEDHYDQFKAGLSSLGRIDLESKKPDSTIGGAYDTISPLASPEKATPTTRIKLTILLPEKPKEALPADQPAR